jgi:hypothetical protein
MSSTYSGSVVGSLVPAAEGRGYSGQMRRPTDPATPPVWSRNSLTAKLLRFSEAGLDELHDRLNGRLLIGAVRLDK